MFIARNGTGQLVDIESVSLEEVCTCPDCGAALIQKRGRIKVPHFAHRSLGDCILPREKMTAWHLDWQRAFSEGCREVRMQNEDAVHRADVALAKTVLEFQHSSIKEEDWTSRTIFYQDLGYRVFWIYDRRGSTPSDDVNCTYCTERGFDAIWFGGNKMCRREFRRATEFCGKDEPVFLDYGYGVLMCWGFERYGTGGYLGSKCVFMTRMTFLDLIHTLDGRMAKTGEPVDLTGYVSGNDWMFARSAFQCLEGVMPDMWYKDFRRWYGSWVIAQRTAIHVGDGPVRDCKRTIVFWPDSMWGKNPVCSISQAKTYPYFNDAKKGLTAEVPYHLRTRGLWSVRKIDAVMLCREALGLLRECFEEMAQS